METVSIGSNEDQLVFSIICWIFDWLHFFLHSLMMRGILWEFRNFQRRFFQSISIFCFMTSRVVPNTHRYQVYLPFFQIWIFAVGFYRTRFEYRWRYNCLLFILHWSLFTLALPGNIEDIHWTLVLVNRTILKNYRSISITYRKINWQKV
jgi:hypothetical protein